MKNRFLFILILTLIFLYVIYYFFHLDLISNKDKNNNAPSSASSTQALRDIPIGWKEYHDSIFNFSLLYPEDMKVLSFNEGGGAGTITFEKVEAGKGFQIFVVPYAKDAVDNDRFRKDLPSGVREGMVNGTVDGATAAFFFSKNDFLGDTYEVWFIYKGYLYEVTTLKNDSTSLEEILKTWKFIRR